MATHVDHLDEDIVHCGDLRYALISFVTAEGKQRLEVNDKVALKIRGAFATKDEADAHIRRLLKTDNKFDVYLVDMYKWLLLPPEQDKIEDVQYQEKYLNDMIREYKESQLLAKQHFQERKELIMKEGLDKHLEEGERIPNIQQELERDNIQTSSERTQSEASQSEASQSDVQP